MEKSTKSLSGLQSFIISVGLIVLGVYLFGGNSDTETNCDDGGINCVSQPRQAETDNQLISDCRIKFNSKMNESGAKRKVQSFPEARVQDNGDGTKFIFIYYRVLDPVTKVWKNTSLRCHLDKNQQLHGPVLAN